MGIVLQQISILYIFLLLGWFFGHIKKGLDSQTGILSFLVVSLFLPSKVFSTFSKNFTVSYLKENYKTLITSVCILIFLHYLGKLLARILTKDGYMKRTYEYSFTISNYAYMGYALAEGIFGEQGLTDLIVFCIPFSLYTYTVGYVKLTGNGKSLKRAVNPMTGAILLGIMFGLLEIPLPAVVKTVLSSSASCVGPITMLLTGITLSSFALKVVFTDKMTYAVVLCRLLLIPALIFGICKLLSLDFVLPSVLFMAAMPTGLNTIVFPKSVGEDPGPGARLAVLSHLLSIATIPLWISLV